MNPHAPSTHPGRHAISERFGVTDLRPLSKALPPADPVGVMAQLVTEAADTLDALHQRLTERAARAIKALLPVSEGSTDNLIGAGGVMPDLAHSLELLSTRRAGAYEHLNQAIFGLRAILPPGAEGARLLSAARKEERKTADRTGTGLHHHNRDLKRDVRGLSYISFGDVRLHHDPETGLPHVLRGVDSIDEHLRPDEVQALIDDGLVSSSGPDLGLTALGARTLQDARANLPGISLQERIHGPRQRALDAVAAGGLRLHEDHLTNTPYTSGTKTPSLFPVYGDVVQDLIGDGLVQTDDSASIRGSGSPLSLTERGKRLHHIGRAETSRVSAALGRSSTPPPGPSGIGDARPPDVTAPGTRATVCSR